MPHHGRFICHTSSSSMLKTLKYIGFAVTFMIELIYVKLHHLRSRPPSSHKSNSPALLLRTMPPEGIQNARQEPTILHALGTTLGASRWEKADHAEWKACVEHGSGHLERLFPSAPRSRRWIRHHARRRPGMHRFRPLPPRREHNHRRGTRNRGKGRAILHLR